MATWAAPPEANTWLGFENWGALDLPYSINADARAGATASAGTRAGATASRGARQAPITYAMLTYDMDDYTDGQAIYTIGKGSR